VALRVRTSSTIVECWEIFGRVLQVPQVICGKLVQNKNSMHRLHWNDILRIAASLFISFVIISVVGSPNAYSAAPSKQDVYDIPEAVAIQGRKYEMDQSFNLTVGYIPTDTFNRGFPISLAYRYSLTPYLSWEVLDFSYVLNHATQTKSDLLALGVQTTNVGLNGKLDFPSQLYITGLNYSPMYSKNLLFNSKLVYSETMLFLGLGAINFNSFGMAPTIAPGIGWRVYVTPKAAVNLYVRDYVYIDSNIGVNAILDFGIGFEYKFHLTGESSHGTKDE
jgi:outer membrane beta-barrel protein